MKKVVLFSLLIICSSFVYAQNDFFISGTLGGGVSSSSFMPLHPYGNNSASYVQSRQYQVNFGINKGKWQLEAGLGYLKTGVSFTSPYSLPVCGMPGQLILPFNYGTASKFTEINNHLVLPVTASYRFFAHRKFSVSAGAGLELLYNRTTTLTSNNADFAESGYVSPFHNNTLSGAALLNIEAGYRINKNFSIICGPSAQCMFTSQVAKIDGEAMSRVYNYAYLLHVGVVYHIPSVEKK